MDKYRKQASAANLIERSFDDAFFALRQALIIENPEISDHAIDVKLKAIFMGWQKTNNVEPENIV